MIVGLTGGIGSGKSSACTFFEKLGIQVISADAITRELVSPGQPALTKITEYFGQNILNQEGNLDRAKLRERIFTNETERQWLEACLHPLVRSEIAQRAQCVTSPYCIVDIPLLVENQLQDTVDRVLVIDCPESIQLERASHRDNVTRAQIEQIMATQTTRTHRLTAADDVITNSQSLTDLALSVSNLHKHYLSLLKTEE